MPATCASNVNLHLKPRLTARVNRGVTGLGQSESVKELRGFGKVI